MTDSLTLPSGECLQLPEGVNKGAVSDGFHTFDELYEHRVALFCALVSAISSIDAEKGALDRAGWSRCHDDGEPCFGGGWLIAWISTDDGEIRYHLPESVAEFLPAELEEARGTPWNGREETLASLRAISG